MQCGRLARAAANMGARQWAPVVAGRCVMLCAHVRLLPCAGCAATADAAACRGVVAA
jgi:hypothetical protein